MPIKIKFFILFLAAFILAGCQTVGLNDGLKILDDNLGKTLNNFQGGQQNSVLDLFNKKNEKASTTAETLTAEQKNKIDDWLEKKGLNKYGDAKNAVYTGGTPLFDEKTGKAFERYEYILNKFPNILQAIKN
jgi:hypothetical protein